MKRMRVGELSTIPSGAVEPPSSALIEVSGLSKHYGDQIALCDISFNAMAGEILGIIGPNGAGKTTLLETIAGLVLADSGVVALRGLQLAAWGRRESIFYVPDGVRPYQEHFVAQVLSFFAAVFRRSPAQIGRLVEALGLGAVLSKQVQELSKGYARRLLLALGFICPHPVLLMDEPFDGFDLRQAREITPLLREQADKGRSLLLSIHQLSDAARVCDRFILLSAGRICGSGTLAELRTRTRLPNANLEELFLALT